MINGAYRCALVSTGFPFQYHPMGKWNHGYGYMTPHSLEEREIISRGLSKPNQDDGHPLPGPARDLGAKKVTRFSWKSRSDIFNAWASLDLLMLYKASKTSLPVLCFVHKAQFDAIRSCRWMSMGSAGLRQPSGDDRSRAHMASRNGACVGDPYPQSSDKWICRYRRSSSNTEALLYIKLATKV